MERNNCSKIRVELSSTIPHQPFDIILANINRNVILQYLQELQQSLHNNSILLLSGLLASDEKDMVQACVKQGLQLLRKTEKNNWISLLFVNGK
jgi:ribosomal protein L11 methyltransferase